MAIRRKRCSVADGMLTSNIYIYTDMQHAYIYIYIHIYIYYIYIYVYIYIYMVFTTEGVLEIAIQSWPE